MSQAPHNPQPAQYQAQPTQMAYSAQSAEADKAAQMSLIFGILGLFIVGIVFGPLAIWQASKAEKLHKPATAGKVLGWIGLILGILWVIGIIFWFVAFAAMMSSV